MRRGTTRRRPARIYLGAMYVTYLAQLCLALSMVDKGGMYSMVMAFVTRSYGIGTKQYGTTITA